MLPPLATTPKKALRLLSPQYDASHLRGRQEIFRQDVQDLKDKITPKNGSFERLRLTRL